MRSLKPFRIQGFPIELKNAGHFDESAGVNRLAAERYLKTLTIPGSADLYRKTAALCLCIMHYV